MTSAPPTRTLWFGYAACALSGCLWGTGFYFGRLALREMSVEYLVFFRFLLASLVLAPAALRYRERLRRQELVLLLTTAFLGVPVQFLLQFHGLARTSVSHAALMVGALPAMLALAATRFTRERLDGLSWLALGGSTAGAAMLVLGGKSGPSAPGAPTLTGDLLVLLSMFTAIFWVLSSKRLMARHHPLFASAYTVLCGTAMLAAVLLGEHLLLPGRFPAPALANVSPTAWAAVVASGLLCTAATTLLWNWGLHHAPASRAGVFLNLEPAIGSLLGVKLLGEHLSPFAGLGGALILAAALVLTLRSRPEPPALFPD